MSTKDKPSILPAQRGKKEPFKIPTTAEIAASDEKAAENLNLWLARFGMLAQGGTASRRADGLYDGMEPDELMGDQPEFVTVRQTQVGNLNQADGSGKPVKVPSYMVKKEWLDLQAAYTRAVKEVAAWKEEYEREVPKLLTLREGRQAIGVRMEILSADGKVVRTYPEGDMGEGVPCFEAKKKEWMALTAVNHERLAEMVKRELIGHVKQAGFDSNRLQAFPGLAQHKPAKLFNHHLDQLQKAWLRYNQAIATAQRHGRNALIGAQEKANIENAAKAARDRKAEEARKGADAAREKLGLGTADLKTKDIDLTEQKAVRADKGIRRGSETPSTPRAPSAPSGPPVIMEEPGGE